MIVAGVIPIWAIANKPEKISGLQQDLNPWPVCCRCSALPFTLYIGSRPNCWVHLNQWKEWYMKSNTKKYDHVTPALKNQRLLPVKANLYFREAVMAFKCMMGLAPEYLGNKFIFRGNISRWKTRSSQSLNIALLKTKTGQRFFFL